MKCDASDRLTGRLQSRGHVVLDNDATTESNTVRGRAIASYIPAYATFKYPLLFDIAPHRSTSLYKLLGMLPAAVRCCARS